MEQEGEEEAIINTVKNQGGQQVQNLDLEMKYLSF
jgi:hypothetical protein